MEVGYRAEWESLVQMHKTLWLSSYCMKPFYYDKNIDNYSEKFKAESGQRQMKGAKDL